MNTSDKRKCDSAHNQDEIQCASCKYATKRKVDRNGCMRCTCGKGNNGSLYMYEWWSCPGGYEKMEPAKAKAPKKAPFAPSVRQGNAYFEAFRWFNNQLFDGKLPPVMLCLTRNANVIGGYHCPDKWRDEKGTLLAEIALNANHMDGENIPFLMEILVHEMLHHWQWSLGKPGRMGYHNKEYADKARELGLRPYEQDPKTGEDTGRDTGDAVRTPVVEGGKTAIAIAEMPDGAIFPWVAHQLQAPGEGGGGSGGEGSDGEEGEDEGCGSAGEGGDRGRGTGGMGGPKPKSGQRAKFTCAICGLNAWAKPGASLLCGDDGCTLVELS